MTKEEKILAYSMRLGGATLQSIADRFGVTREYIRQITQGAGTREALYARLSNCVYPNIRKWMIDHSVTYTGLATRADLNFVSIQKALEGNCGTSKKTIDKILEATGMTYEVAFALDTAEGDSHA